jgi:hypothetical protein
MSFLTFLLSFSRVSTFSPYQIARPQNSPYHNTNKIKPISSNATVLNDNNVMQFADNVDKDNDIGLYFSSNEGNSAQIKKYMIEIIEKIDNLPKEKKEALGVLMRSKKLKGGWGNQVFEYLRAFWGKQWSKEYDNVLRDIIKESFHKEHGQRLLKGILVYLKHDPALFSLTKNDKIKLSIEDRYVLLARKQIEDELDKLERDRNERSDNVYWGMRILANSSDSDARITSSVYRFADSALDSRSRTLKEKRNDYSLDKTIDQHEQDQKLFHKLLTGSHGVVKKLFDSILKSREYIENKEEFDHCRLSYEFAEAAIRKYMTDSEILNKVAGLIADPVFIQKKSFSENSKGLEEKYFFESVKRIIVFSVPIIIVSHAFEGIPKIIPWFVVPAGVSGCVLNDRANSEWTDLALEAAQIRAAAEDPNYVYF